MLRWSIKQRVNAVAGVMTAVLLKVARRFDHRRMSDFLAAVLRRIGPWLPEHRVGRANLTAAFPEKSPAEIEAILAGVWENLGRVAADFAHLDRIDIPTVDRPFSSSVEYEPRSFERFVRLRDSGQGSLIFTAHLGNWELPARIAAASGVKTAVLYRRPNIGAAAEAIAKIRHANMGILVPAAPDAPFRLAALLQEGVHVGMLVDQHFDRGVEVEFFGRRCKANPTLARLARHFDCPIQGIRLIRIGEHRFRAELTDAIPAVRDSSGKVDVQKTMQAVTTVVEQWVRETPEQWLWLHRRWR